MPMRFYHDLDMDLIERLMDVSMRLKRLTRQLNWARRNGDRQRYRHLQAELEDATGRFYHLIGGLAGAATNNTRAVARARPVVQLLAR